MIRSDNDLSGLEHHGPIRFSLFAFRYSLFAIRYSLFAIRYSMLARQQTAPITYGMLGTL
jgi:hypothetical protein